MKKWVLLVALVCVVAVPVLASPTTEKSWFDMQNCAMCKSMTAEKGLLEHTSFDTYVTSTGLVSVCTVDPAYKEAFARAGAKMTATMKDLEAGKDVGPLCGFCTSYGELMKANLGINMVHVPYRGQAPAIADLLSGQVQVLFATSPAAMEFIRSGKLKALAVTTTRRADALPDLPTVGDFVPGYEASAWYGIGAPRKTPADIVDRLAKETNAGLADARLKLRLADLGGTLIPGSPADFATLIAEETEKWGKVIRAANIKL